MRSPRVTLSEGPARLGSARIRGPVLDAVGACLLWSVMAVDLAEGPLAPGQSASTAVAYLLMGIPRELSTPLFVCSRITGWCAHVMEQQDHNRLIRPRALYTGPAPRAYESLDRRA